MSPKSLQTYQEETIQRFGGTIEAKKAPKQVKLDVSGKKIPPHHETLTYFSQGIPFEEIAEMRSLKISTIFTHLEKLLEEKIDIDLSPYQPDDGMRMKNIHDAFVAVGSLKLVAVRQYLFETYEEEYTFDELRLVRLFLSEEDLVAIEEAG